MVGMLPALWLINELFVYPPVDSSTILPMLLAITLAALFSGWIGFQLGNYLGRENKQVAKTNVKSRLVQLAPVVAFISIVGFIVLFIVTAEPPL